MSIELPRTLVAIGDNVFQGCTGLPELTIPKGVTSMGSRAVADCSALQAVSLPDSLESIGESCFASDVSLREIVLPAHLQHIGRKAFAGCQALKTIVYGNSAAKWKEQAESGQDYPAATYVWCSDDVLRPEGEEVPKITCSVRETEDYAPEKLKKGMTLKMECTFTGVPNGVMVEPQLEGFSTSETAWKTESGIASFKITISAEKGKIASVSGPSSVCGIPCDTIKDWKVVVGGAAEPSPDPGETEDPDQKPEDTEDPSQNPGVTEGPGQQPTGGTGGGSKPGEEEEPDDTEQPGDSSAGTGSASPGLEPSRGPQTTASPVATDSPSAEPSAQPSSVPGSSPTATTWIPSVVEPSVVTPPVSSTAAPSSTTSAAASSETTIEVDYNDPHEVFRPKPDAPLDFSVVQIGDGIYLQIGGAKNGTSTDVRELYNSVALPGQHNLVVCSADGRLASVNARLATGMYVEVRDARDSIVLTVRVVVPGDVNGDSEITLSDLVLMAEAYTSRRELEGPYLAAADLDGSGRINLTDLVMEARLVAAR